ncbi:MAG: hypothetical protein KKD31_07580 [Bacteroidetes bacterium]|nr:hypothetical protein [Bacteroidota bacterium]
MNGRMYDPLSVPSRYVFSSRHPAGYVVLFYHYISSASGIAAVYEQKSHENSQSTIITFFCN